MTQQATVLRRLSEGRVEISVRRQSACGHSCAGCGGCGAGSAPSVTAVAEDSLGAQPGQRVTVESATRRILPLAGLLYLLPFLAFFAAYLLLHEAREGVAALGAVGGFLAVLLGVCLPLDRYMRRRRVVTFRVTGIGG